MGTTPRLDRILEEISVGGYRHVLLGCRSAVEAELFDRLLDACGNFDRVYVGRLARADVEALTRLVDPVRSESIAAKAIEVVRQHSLPSTPFTFSMIVSAILRGESLLNATSPTTLLDAYLDVLLGRGGPEEDSRFGLDAANRGYILGEVAELFVRRKSGALPQMDVVACLQRSFELLDWPSVPVDTIKDMQARHILVLRGGEVSFTQSSYLHLFAARRAIEDADFLEYLTNDSLYYAPVLAHYAALKRSDVALVQLLLPMLDPFLEEEFPRSSAFRDVAFQAEYETIEQVGGRIDREALFASREEPSEDDLVPIDALNEDVTPFPLAPMDDQPPMARMVVTLGLLSNVLRDTEIFRDHELRKHAFTRILEGWAQIADRAESDSAFDTTIEALVERMSVDYRLSQKRAERLTDDVRSILPMSMAIGGITATLSTQKLSRTAERCLADEDFASDPALALLAIYLLLDSQSPGWSSSLAILNEKHRDILGVRKLLRRVLLVAYFRIPQAGRDEENIQGFLVEQMIEEGIPRSEAARTRMRGEVLNRLKKAKLRWRSAQLPAGQSPMLSVAIEQ
jgi:hypothetical protein